MVQAEKRLYAVADLWRIAETNDTNALKGVLSSGIDVDAPNEHGTTALMRAVCHGRLKMVEALISNGADPNAVRNDNFTPLTLAAFFGHTDIVRLLVQSGADTDRVTRNGTSARMWASARTFKQLAKYLDEVPPVKPVLEELAVDDTEPVMTLDQSDVGVVNVEATEEPCEVVIVGPEIEKIEESVGRSSFVARLPLLRMEALAALITIMSLAVVVLVSRNQAGRTQPLLVGQSITEPTTEPITEPKLDDVGPDNKSVSEPDVESSSRENEVESFRKSTDRRAAFDERRPARTLKRKSANYADDQGPRGDRKKASKSVAIRTPVPNPAPTSKQLVTPLSTQMVSSPSQSGSKPKVIQWP